MSQQEQQEQQEQQQQGQQWERAADLFEAALQMPESARAAYLEQACAGEQELLLEVKALLSAHSRTGILDQTQPNAPPPAVTLSPINMDASAGAEIGPYRILAEIGRGGMGVIYKAQDRRLGRFVALKFLRRDLASDPSAKGRFLAEAKSAGSLDHPNICTVYDIGQTGDGQIYIAMAYYEGETLAARIAREPLSVDECVELALQIASGLEAAHEVGIVHRDIKPSNIILTSRAHAKILDFGVAKLEGVVVTGGGARVGTVSYAPPEQLRGEEADCRADIWSLGVVLYEMLCRRVPFSGHTQAEVVDAVLHLQPEALATSRPDVPEWLAEAIHRALSKAAADRFASMGEFAAALRRGVEGRHARREGRIHLPVAMTSFVGRQRELERARTLLSAARLVTITGPAGTGKTRFSLEVARQAAQEFRDGVYFVSLAPITDPGLVMPAVAETLQVLRSGGGPVVEEIAAILRNQQVLLVLDNFEQVTAAAPQVAALLQSCPEVKALITSRIALRLVGEHEMPLAPLECPHSEAPLDLEELLQVASVRLFVERASALHLGFTLNAGNARAIIEICQRLDGLPLAIELAAARIRILPPEAIVRRLGSRLDLLKGGERDRPARHQTLRQALAWSYDLLDESQRRLFRRCAVFVGGFTLDTAEAMAEALEDSSDTLEGVSALVDHSLLVQTREESGEPRFWMLETIREYALECLNSEGDSQAARRAHAQCYREMAEAAHTELIGSRQAECIRRLEADHDNLRAALNWLEEQQDQEGVLRACVGVWRFWTARGHLREGLDRIERALARGEERLPRLLLADALNAAGTLSHGMCQMAAAQRLLHRSLVIFRAENHSEGAALVLNNLAWIDIEMSNFDTAGEFAIEAYGLHEKNGNRRGMAVALNNFGWLAIYQSEFEAALDYHSRSLEHRRAAQDLRGMAFALSNMAWAAQRAGKGDEASGYLKQAESILSRVSDPLLDAWATQMRAAVAYDRGDVEQAIKILERCLPIWRRVGNTSGLAFGIVYYSQALLKAGLLDRAAEVLSEAERQVAAIPQRWGCAMLLLARARLHMARGDAAAGVACCHEAAPILARLGDRRGLAEAHECLAALLLASDPKQAARHLGAARKLREQASAPLPVSEHGAVERMEKELTMLLGKEQYAQLFADANPSMDARTHPHACS